MYFLIQAQRETWPQNPLEQKDCKHVSGIIASSPWLFLALNPWDEPALQPAQSPASAVWGALSSSFQVGLFTGIPLQPFPWLWCLYSPRSDHSLCPLEQPPRGSLWRAGIATPGSDSCTCLGQPRALQDLSICEAKQQEEIVNAGAAAPSPGSAALLGTDPDSPCIFNDALCTGHIR